MESGYVRKRKQKGKKATITDTDGCQVTLFLSFPLNGSKQASTLRVGEWGREASRRENMASKRGRNQTGGKRVK